MVNITAVMAMSCLQTVERPLAGCLLLKIADFTSQTQDNHTITIRFSFNFPALRWSQRTLVIQVNFYRQLWV